jgi:signal transduction histidine kinase
MHIESLFNEEDRENAVDNFRRRLRGEPPVRIEYHMRRKDGTNIPVLIYSVPIIREGETVGLRGVLVDITEQKLAEEQVRLANQERYQQMKEIAGGIAHEIYNALYPASVSIERIRRLIGDHETCEPERVDKLVNLTDKAVRRAIGLTESVTRFSRLESEKQEERISLQSLFDEIVEGNQPRLESLAVDLRREIAEGLTVTLRKTHAYSLFNNLVVNALDAVEETDRREVQIVGRSDNGWVRVEITDSGIGIPAEVRDKVFAPFYSTKPNRGTGLGLAMAVKLAELYGGAIRLDPGLDTKTRFVILLPQAVTL